MCRHLMYPLESKVIVSDEHTYSLFESKVSVSTCIFGEILLILVIFINLAAKVDS